MILMVDDEEDMLRLLEVRLSNAGYPCMKAKNGKEAIEIASKMRPKLIMMDIMMPEMDGLEAVKKLKSDPQTAGIPVMMLTACADKDSEENSFSSGAASFVKKPFDPEDLLTKVKTLLEPSVA
jgi:CheY-like chemotaxis protein